jgi:hypothetical protein
MSRRLRLAALRVAGCAAVVSLAAAASAAPPPGTNTSSPEAGWYRSLAQPTTGYGCCSIADCRPVPFETKSGHYSAFIGKAQFPQGDDAWHDVPDTVVIRDKPNPTGEAVACWYARQVRCFVLPSLT